MFLLLRLMNGGIVGVQDMSNLTTRATTIQPDRHPTNQPSNQHTSHPTNHPTNPTNQGHPESLLFKTQNNRHSRARPSLRRRSSFVDQNRIRRSFGVELAAGGESTCPRPVVVSFGIFCVSHCVSLRHHRTCQFYKADLHHCILLGFTTAHKT